MFTSLAGWSTATARTPSPHSGPAESVTDVGGRSGSSSATRRRNGLAPVVFGRVANADRSADVAAVAVPRRGLFGQPSRTVRGFATVLT